MRVIRKLLVPTLIFIGLIIAGLITFNTIKSNQRIDQVETQHLESMNETFNVRLNSLGDLAIALASEVANNPEVQVAFAAKDRERLIELTLASYQSIDTQLDIPQFQFHVAPATSFLRLHNLEKFGDDLSSFRFTVLTANAERKAVSGPEIGRGGLGVRGVVPVSYEGQHIGTVEFGTNVDQALLENLKKSFGVEWQLLLSRSSAKIATFEGATAENSQGPIDELLLQSSTLASPIYGPTKNYEEALAGTTSIEHTNNIEGREYAILSAPLYDFSGNVIGVIDIISDHTAIIKQQNAQILLSLGILLATLLFIGFGFSIIANRILRPIGTLATTATVIAKGDFTQRVDVISDDEIGELAQAFNTMTEQLQDSFTNLERRIANRTRALEISTEVSRRLSTILDQDQLVKEVVNELVSAFNYYYAHIYLFDDDKNTLVMKGGTGEAGQVLLSRGHTIQKGRGLVGRAAEENQVILVGDTLNEEGWLPNELLPETRSECAVPIAIGDKILGVFDVQHNIINGITEEDATLLQSIANQVAIAVQNAQAFTQAQAQAEIEERVNIIGQKIQTASTVEETIQTAVQELSLALDGMRVTGHIAGRQKENNA